MKNFFFRKIVVAFQSFFINKNYEWDLAKKHHTFDTNNLDLCKDMSVIQH
jgi:hypothetical protein